MAYEEILTVNSSIQSKRTTKTTADSSTEVLKDGELLIVRDGTNPPNLRAGDGTTQIQNLKDMVPGVDSALSSTSTNPVQNKVIKTELGTKLSLSGGTMTGALTTKGIKLTSGTDYGTTLPSNPDTNQLFFQTIGSNFVLDNVYPVGSIYMNVNSTNPGTLFGGTWEQIQGRFLLGMSSSYPAGSSGGESTHTLTESEMPSHNHKFAAIAGSDGNAFSDFPQQAQINAAGTAYPSHPAFPKGADWSSYGGITIEPVGGSQPHNNMPPYLSVYIWKRTA